MQNRFKQQKHKERRINKQHTHDDVTVKSGISIISGECENARSGTVEIKEILTQVLMADQQSKVPKSA